MPADVNARETVARIGNLAPDFFFSFYFRQMLKPALLAIPARGALNMHGSLLPKYRGRVPVNWAVLHGERETGATLHYMADKPDAGDIVAQIAVPILPDDTAGDVFAKVTVAAEIALDHALPALLAGTAPRIPMNLAAGSYFGGRTPDGRADRLVAGCHPHPQSRARCGAAVSRRHDDRRWASRANPAHARAGCDGTTRDAGPHARQRGAGRPMRRWRTASRASARNRGTQRRAAGVSRAFSRQFASSGKCALNMAMRPRGPASRPRRGVECSTLLWASS